MDLISREPEIEERKGKSAQNVPKEDLISRKAAIEATWFEPSYTDPLNVLTEVRDKLKALPSAQSAKHTEERAKTHACDCISRRAAIDHWRSIIDATDEGDRYNMGFDDGLEFCISDLSTMPSAQPEIVRCKDCRHYLNSNEKCALIDTRLNFYATEKRWNGDSFCSWAERRTDE